MIVVRAVLGLNVKMSSWIKIGVEFFKTLAGQWNDRSHADAPSEADGSTAMDALVSSADSVRPESQISVKTEDSSNHQELERHGSNTAAEGLGLGADSIAVRPESQISIQQERERRRKIVRQFFNDFWRSTDDKPVTFVERLNRAEGYVNERLAASGEAWQLDPTTRKQLGLPPRRRAPP